MGTIGIDYAAMLADLEAKKAVIDSAIASVRAAMAAGALGVSVGDSLTFRDSVNVVQSPSASSFNGDIPSGMFRGKSIPEATKLYLSMTNKKQSTKEIALALEEGGLHTTSDNFSDTVNAGLFRASRKFGEIVRVKGYWALAEWYKGMRIGPQDKKTPVKGKVKRKAKTASYKGAGGAPKRQAKPKEHPSSSGGQATIEGYFSAHPGEEFSNAEIASALNIRVQTVSLICGKLAHQGNLEKTSSGKFRSAKVHAMPKAV